MRRPCVCLLFGKPSGPPTHWWNNRSATNPMPTSRPKQKTTEMQPKRIRGSDTSAYELSRILCLESSDSYVARLLVMPIMVVNADAAFVFAPLPPRTTPLILQSAAAVPILFRKFGFFAAAN